MPCIVGVGCSSLCKDGAKTGAMKTRFTAPTNSESTVLYETYKFPIIDGIEKELRNEIKLNSVNEVYGGGN